MIVSSIALSLALLSVLLNFWQWTLGRRFPLHIRTARPEFCPPVSILKPLNGCDAETEACLESWFLQDYPAEHELLFAAKSPEDPVCDIVRRLIERHPARTARLILAETVLGPNGKVSSLCHLARAARFEHLVISDADIFAGPELLSNLVAPLQEKSIGLVSCFYSFSRPKNFAMRLEAVSINADFWAQVLHGIALWPMDFALGAAMTVRKEDLAAIGGFESLLEYLADDYQLGHRLARLGRKLTMCTIPVECRSGPLNPRAVWKHQVRWSRTIRFCEPAGFFFSILGNATLWPVLAALFAGRAGLGFLAAALILRMLSAAGKARRLTRTRDYQVALLAPLVDVFSAILWVTAWLGREITWRNARFRVSRGGKLTHRA